MSAARRFLFAVLTVALGLVFALPTAASASSSKPTITIGSTNFEEQEIVANLYGDVLTKAGYPVKIEPALGTRAVVVPALEHGQIDLEPDYAASLLGFLHGGNPQPAGTNIAKAPTTTFRHWPGVEDHSPSSIRARKWRTSSNLIPWVSASDFICASPPQSGWPPPGDSRRA